MRVFLTGGTGFIGQALAGTLVRRGWEVTALVRDPSTAAARALAGPGVSLVPGDVAERESMRGPMAGADVVIHNAGWYELGIGGRQAERRMEAVNVDGARNALTLAHELGVPRIVHVSSIVAAGETGDVVRDETFARRSKPASPYERTKAEAHAIAMDLVARGAPVLLAMPAGVFGPGDHSNVGILARMYVRGFAPPLTIGGGFRRSQVHVDDCAEGIALVAEKGRIGEAYILSAGSPSYGETYAIWAATPGGFRPLANLPRPLALLSGALAEPVQRLLGLPNLLSLEAVRGAHTHYLYSGEKAMRELGWTPGDVRRRWIETLAEERRRAGKA